VDWLVAAPCFLFTVVIAMFSVVFDLPMALRIVMIVVAAALLGAGGALLGRSGRTTGWRPSDDLRRDRRSDDGEQQ